MEQIAGHPDVETHHITDAERRRHPRTFSRTTCLVKTREGVREYVVSNLSVSGALLIGGPPLGEGYPLDVLRNSAAARWSASTTRTAVRTRRTWPTAGGPDSSTASRP